jgi:hypothetical protein
LGRGYLDGPTWDEREAKCIIIQLLLGIAREGW